MKSTFTFTDKNIFTEFEGITVMKLTGETLIKHINEVKNPITWHYVRRHINEIKKGDVILIANSSKLCAIGKIQDCKKDENQNKDNWIKFKIDTTKTEVLKNIRFKPFNNVYHGGDFYHRQNVTKLNNLKTSRFLIDRNLFPEVELDNEIITRRKGYPKPNKETEEKAIEFVKFHYEINKKIILTSREKDCCGWDLESDTHKVEVKGLSGELRYVELTPNEWEMCCKKKNIKHYSLFIVYNLKHKFLTKESLIKHKDFIALRLNKEYIFEYKEGKKIKIKNKDRTGQRVGLEVFL
ncbi:MAG: DUF3883 domain-containing protein [Ignavibacteria bacterium]|nr:DUF3883 domain-containing protein [Ignavibacteria bacterium]